MIISLTQILLGTKDYKALGSFFDESWNRRGPADEVEDYRYRVYISRRCFLLNEIFYQEKPTTFFGKSRKNTPEQVEDLRKNTFLNQYGLMCKARELAESYGSKMRGFPPILVVDELAICGREISRLLLRMTELIIDAYGEMFGPVSSETEDKIRNDFLSAVDIRVYGKNEKGLLLPDTINRRLTSSINDMPTKRWRAFVQTVSTLICHSSGIWNKSYYPIFSLPKGSLHSPAGEAQSHGYHGNRLFVYQRRENGILFTFCERTAGSRSEFLPIPLWGDIPKERASILLKETAKVFEDNAQSRRRTDFRYVIGLLQETAQGLLQVQFQLISFIMAVISFYDFAQEHGLQHIDDKICGVDVDRCAMNFGLVRDLEPELREITNGENGGLRDALKKVIYEAFSQDAVPCTLTEGEKTGDVENLLRATESYFLEISNADEKALTSMRENNLVFDILTKDYDMLSLQDYLSADGIPGSIEDRVFSMLLLLTDGQISLNVRLYDGMVQLRLKTGEYVKSIEAERLRYFIPALSALEDWSGRAGFSPESKLCEFGRFLGEVEPTLYKGLDEIFHAFVSTQYACADKVSDWNIDFMTGGNVPDPKHGEWLVHPWSGQPWSIEEKERFETSELSYWQWEKAYRNGIQDWLTQYVRTISH